MKTKKKKLKIESLKIDSFSMQNVKGGRGKEDGIDEPWVITQDTGHLCCQQNDNT